MSEIHPHDALLARLNEEQFESRKMYGMWGGCDWRFIDADPDALVIEVVAKRRPHEIARNIAENVITRYAGHLATARVRTWSRLSGSADEPLLQEFPLVADGEPFARVWDSVGVWARCAAAGWERGAEAKARPEPGEVHRVVNVVSAAPATPKPYEEMTEADIHAWAGAWAKQIVASIEAQQGDAR